MVVLYHGICEGDPLKEWESEIEKAPIVVATPEPVLARNDNKTMSKADLQKTRLQRRQDHRRNRKQRERVESSDMIVARGFAGKFHNLNFPDKTSLLNPRKK